MHETTAIERLTRSAELAEGRAQYADLLAHMAGVLGETSTRETQLWVAKREREEAARDRDAAAALAGDAPGDCTLAADGKHAIHWMKVPARRHNGSVVTPAHQRGFCWNCDEHFTR